jgi:hypothetical protein
MSGDHAKKMVIGGEKSATSHEKAPSRESANKKKDGSPSRIRSHKSGEKKKKMKKVVYYETDSSSPSTSGSDAASVTSKRQERKKYSKIPLRYPHIPKHTPLLSVPLGKPPTFDGEDYSRWSDMMRYHLISLHKSIWDVVEFVVQVPSVGDEDYDEDEVAQIVHFNSQATTILLTSLSREEYNKVQGLKSAKEICDGTQDRARRRRGDQDHQAGDDRGGARSLLASPRGGATRDVQPTQDLGEPSAQPRKQKMG